MKFNVTGNVSNRKGIGEVPRKFIDYTIGDHTKIILKYFYDNIKLHDWDDADEETYDFVFEDGKAYRLIYELRSEWYHENDDENGLRDRFHVEEISISDANVPCKNFKRDWL